MEHFLDSQEIRIRPATEEDFPDLVNIFNDVIIETEATCYLHPFSLEERYEWWRSHQDPRYPIYVAQQMTKTVGYASLSIWMPGPIYAATAEASVFLAPEARGRGLGKNLLLTLLAHASDQRLHVVIARVWAQNAVSLLLCRQLGFASTGVQQEVGWRDGKWMDCVVLQRILSEGGAPSKS